MSGSPLFNTLLGAAAASSAIFAGVAGRADARLGQAIDVMRRQLEAGAELGMTLRALEAFGQHDAVHLLEVPVARAGLRDERGQLVTSQADFFGLLHGLGSVER